MQIIRNVAGLFMIIAGWEILLKPPANNLLSEWALYAWSFVFFVLFSTAGQMLIRWRS